MWKKKLKGSKFKLKEKDKQKILTIIILNIQIDRIRKEEQIKSMKI